MQAIVISRSGGPEVLELRRVPDPSCGPEDVGVRVRATALNRADLLQRRGRYPAPPGAPPDIPGLEFAGRVETVGERVRAFACGDRVMGIVAGGGHAERVVLHERLCLPVPAALSWDEAAAIPEAFLTAYDALFRLGRLTVGETLLVPAAGSGVGTAAVQLAALGGARVVALSRSAPKRARLHDLGAHAVLDPAIDGLADAIRGAAGGGVDVVLDLLGRASGSLHTGVLREHGRIVVIGLLEGSRAEIDLSELMRKRAALVGSVLRSRPLEEKAVLAQEFGARVLPLIAAGRLRAVVDRSYDWRAVAEAHARMERNENFGKIVLRVP
jgi:putative PIG3 family NAD(P)H quinone oxidoreductase